MEHATLLRRSLGDASRLVSAAAAIATALVLGDRIEKRALDALREAGRHPDMDPVAYPVLEGGEVPLPREELSAFWERCGEVARPALEASLAKKHGARCVIERALERIG